MILHSSFELSYLWLPLVGFIVGFFASVTGGGGGFFFLPILTIFFGIPAQVAVATSLAATLPVCIAGSYSYYRKGNIDMRIGLVFALTGVIGALTGAGLTSIMNTRQLKNSFGIYSILIAFQMVFATWKKKRAEANGTVISPLSNIRKISKGSFYGFLAGVITGTFGTSGTAPVLAGMFDMRMPIKLVLGTSLLIVFANTVSALGAHFLMGKIDLTLVYFLTAGTIIGAITGPGMLAKVNIDRAEEPVKQWYALGMIVFGIIMIFS